MTPAIMSSASFFAGAILATSAPAQITSYSDKPSYDAAVGAHATISFSEIPTGSILGTQYQPQGVTFIDGNDQTLFNGAFVVDGVGVAGNGRVDVSFGGPQTHVGVEFPGALAIDLCSGTTFLDQSIHFAGAGAGFFGGVVSSLPFDRAVLRDWYDDAVYIDELHFGGVAPPLVYCGPAGPNADGCAATIAASAHPSASHTSGCTITVSDLPPNRFGIIFYNTSGAQNVEWCAPGVGNSRFCVAGLVWRTPLQDSGGGAAACDGTLTLDWDAYQRANPGALGQTWSPSDHAWVQGWFRSPSDCRFSFMSQAVELIYQ
jgi:hypothetical protein